MLLFFDKGKTSHHSRAVTFTQIGDYMEAGTGTTIFFHFKKKKVFHYSLHIKDDLKRKPGCRRVNAV